MRSRLRRFQVDSQSLFVKSCRRFDQSPTTPLDHVVLAARRAIVRDPANAAAVTVLAAVALHDRKPAECLERIGSLQGPGDDSLQLQLAGFSLARLGQGQAALEYLSKAVRIEPQLVDCWLKLAQIHDQSGQLQLAIAYYRRGLLFEGPDHACSISLSRMLMRNGRVRAAINVLHNSLCRDRRSPSLNTELAKLLQRRASRLRRKRHVLASEKVLAGAAECYRVAAQSQSNAAPYVSLGIIEQRLGRFASAADAFRKAVQIDPQNTRATMLLANHRMDEGHIELAVKEYERVLAINPSHAQAHFRYSRSQKFSECETTRTYLEKLQTAIQRTRKNTSRSHLHFALAKVLDDLGEYDLAWANYERANRLKPSHVRSEKRRGTSDPDRAHQAMFDAPIKFFNEGYFQNIAGGSQSELPVFIVGMPRSGTTLVEQILSSHTKISGAGELKDVDRIRHQLCIPDETLLDGPLRPSPGFFRQARLAYPEVLASVSDSQLTRLADQYLERLTAGSGDAVRVTDKMPTNFLHLGLIASLFPHATIIHCRRNPMDVFVSSYSQNLNAPFCDLEALVQYYHGYQRLMNHWYEVLPQRIHTVDYESLVQNPETESRKLVSHCRLEWEDRCLRFEQNERAVHTPSKWQVRQPMYSSSVDRWKRFERHLTKIAQAVGVS